MAKELKDYEKVKNEKVYVVISCDGCDGELVGSGKICQGKKGYLDCETPKISNPINYFKGLELMQQLNKSGKHAMLYVRVNTEKK